MNTKIIKVLIRKELTEILKDKKNIFLVFFTPILLFPFVFLIIFIFSNIQNKKIENTIIEVQVNSKVKNSILYDYISRNKYFKLSLITQEPNEQVTLRKKVIVVSDDIINDSILEHGSARIKVLYDLRDDYSIYGKNYIRNSINILIARINKNRLNHNHLDPDMLNPFDVTYQSIKVNKSESIYLLSNMIPGILFFFAFVGTIFISIDLTIGEKERKTILSLLFTPIQKIDIFLGKYLMVVLFCFISYLGNLLGILSVLYLNNELNLSPFLKYDFYFNFYQIWWMTLLMIASSSLISVITFPVMSVCKNIKDSNIYLFPLSMFFLIPSVLYNLPGFELNDYTCWIPIINILLGFESILKLEYSNYLPWVFISSILHTLIFMFPMNKIFQKYIIDLP